MNMEERQLKRRTDEKNRVHTFTHRLLGGNTTTFCAVDALLPPAGGACIYSAAPSVTLHVRIRSSFKIK